MDSFHNFYERSLSDVLRHSLIVDDGIRGMHSLNLILFNQRFHS